MADPTYPNNEEREKESAARGRAIGNRRPVAAEIDWDDEVLPSFRAMMKKMYRSR